LTRLLPKEINLGDYMPTHSRKHSVAIQIEEKILAKKKKTPAQVALKILDKDKGWITITIEPEEWPISMITLP
jgi:hypothetical protein